MLIRRSENTCTQNFSLRMLNVEYCAFVGTRRNAVPDDVMRFRYGYLIAQNFQTFLSRLSVLTVRISSLSAQMSPPTNCVYRMYEMCSVYWQVLAIDNVPLDSSTTGKRRPNFTPGLTVER